MRMRAGSGSSVCWILGRWSRTKPEDHAAREALGRRVRGDLGTNGAFLLRVIACPAHPEAVAGFVLAGEDPASSRAIKAARQPRLVEERRLHDPGRVRDRRGHQRLHPAAADGAARDRADLNYDRRGLVGLQPDAIVCASWRSRGRCSSRSPTAVQAEPLGRGGRLRRLDRRAASRGVTAAGSAAGRAARSSSSVSGSLVANAVGGTPSIVAGRRDEPLALREAGRFRRAIRRSSAS